MKTRTVLCLLVTTCAVLALSCNSHHQNGTATSDSSTTNTPPAIAVRESVRWTLETKIPEVPAERTADVRQHMAEFAQKGWSVLSVTTHIRPEDGKQYRKWELQRDAP